MNQQMTMHKLMAAVLLFLLIGCEQTLYTGLKEKEANEMIALLMERGIKSSKSYEDRTGAVSLAVGESDVVQAVNTLRDHGFPKSQHTNLGEVFSKNSLISSPTEEHARYTYALSEDLSQTLSELDGVIYAKVHLVLPDLKAKDSSQASAAVFIKHATFVQMENFIPQIKLLVQGSVKGLKYEDVNVALFPALREQSSQVAANQVGSGVSGMVGQSLGSARGMIALGLGLVLLICLLGAGLILAKRYNLALFVRQKLGSTEGAS